MKSPAFANLKAGHETKVQGQVPKSNSGFRHYKELHKSVKLKATEAFSKWEGYLSALLSIKELIQ